MNPVRGQTMLSFIHWLAAHHPKVRNLRGLGQAELLSLITEYEGGCVLPDSKLATKWLFGFRILLNQESNCDGYDAARSELNQLQSSPPFPDI
jgi:hypothetical protein